MKKLIASRLPSLLAASVLTLAGFAANPATAAVVGPYSSDANTIFLFHLDESAGSNLTTNSATLTAGTNAVTFRHNTATTNAAPFDSNILGVPGAAGFTFGNFGNCAVITNGFGLTNISTGAVSNGIGVDFNLNGVFSYWSNALNAANAGDSLPNHILMVGPDNAFTLEALINLSVTNTPTGTGREIICTDSQAGTRGFQFRINAGNIEFNYIGSGPAGFLAPIPSSGPNGFVSNAWFHVAVVHSEVGGSPTNVVYWTRLDDTTTAANAIFTNTVETVNATAVMPIVIGNEGRLTGGSSEGLRGYIDEVRISRAARAPNQMMFSTPDVTVVQPPVNEGVDYGGSGTLTVSAASSLPLTYQWRLNNVPITDATNASYSFANASAANAGNYDCVIANSFPSSTTSAVSVVTIGAANFLAHRYGFTNDANDSIGGANGTLVGTALVNAGALQLDGTFGTHMQLPSYLITNMGMVSFECWATYGVNGNFARLFDFGNTNGANGNNYVFFSPHTATTTHRLVIGNAANEQTIDTAGVYDGRTVHVACVIDPINRQLSVYTNGVLETVNNNITFQLTGVNDVYSFIGRSMYSADAYLNANLDELRIYNGALSASSVRQSYLQGPGTSLNDGPVSMLISPTNTTTAQGQPVSFYGLATGHPAISYRWYENGSPLANGTNSTLTFVASFGQNGHTFQLWATNVVSSTTYVASSSVATLSVLIPETLTWIGTSDSSWNTASLNWSNATALVPYVLFDGALFDNRGSAQPLVNLQIAANPIALTVNASSDYLFTSFAQNGSLTGSADLLKQGSGTLTLDVTNAMTGNMTIQGGTLQIGNGGNAGTLSGGALTNNGALVFNIANDLTYPNAINGSGSVASVGPGGNVTLSGSISGSSVTMSGFGNLFLSGSNSYTGPTVISAGVLHARNNSALGTADAGTSATINGQLYIDANVNIPSEALILGGGALRKGGGGATALGGSVTLVADTTIQIDGNSTLTLTNAGGATGTDVNVTLNADGGGQGTINGPLSIGIGTLTKNGNGNWTLGSAVDNYSGKTAINGGNGGLLRVGTAAALGTAPGAFTPDQITLTGSGLGATASFALDDGARGITISGAGVLSVDAGATLTISNEIAGLGSITKIGAGTLVLSGSNSFTGVLNVGNDAQSLGNYPSFVNDGNVRITTSAALFNILSIVILENNGGNSTLQLDGSAGDLNIPAPIRMLARGPSIPGIQNLAGSNTLSGGFNIDVGGALYQVQSDGGTLVFSGPVSCVAALGGTRTLTFQGTGRTLVSGDISSGTAATFNVLKTGSGTLTLGGFNSYNGATVISNGTLLVTGSINGGTVTNFGGTLGGTGTITVPVTIAPGGTLAPGASVGTLTIVSDLTLAGNMSVEVDKSQVQTSDLVVVGGTLVNTGTGTVLVNNLGPALTIGNSFQLFDHAIANGNALHVAGAGAIWNNNLAFDGTISVASVTIPHPGISNISLTGTNVVFNGTNGYANGLYYVLASTNLTAPLSSWTSVLTNTFDGSGNFSVTNAITPGTPQRFYILKVP